MSHYKFLGMIVNEHLNWNECIDSVCSKLNKQYYALLNLKTTLHEEGLLTAYYALVYSAISYNIVVSDLAVESNRIFLAQKRIIRRVSNLGYRESCRQTFEEKKILTFTSIYFGVIPHIFFILNYEIS